MHSGAMVTVLKNQSFHCKLYIKITCFWQQGLKEQCEKHLFSFYYVSPNSPGKGEDNIEVSFTTGFPLFIPWNLWFPPPPPRSLQTALHSKVGKVMFSHRHLSVHRRGVGVTGCVWSLPQDRGPIPQRYRQHGNTVNAWSVRILLECILVFFIFTKTF